MNGILVPIDFSDYSLNALRFAVQLAKLSRKPITVFNCFSVSPTPGINTPPIEYLQESEKEKKKELTAKMQSLLALNGSELAEIGDVEFVVEKGVPTEKISELANKRDFDFVVMGTKGASGLAEIIFGSTTQKVVEQVRCNLIAVPIEAKFEGFEKIVYATDFHQNDVEVIEYLLKFASYFDSKLTCLHVCSDDEMKKLDFLVIDTLDDHFDVMKDDIGKRIPNFDNKNLSFRLVEGKDPEKSIKEYLDKHPAELLAVVPQRSENFIDRIFHSSFTKKLLYHSKTPLFVVKDQCV